MSPSTASTFANSLRKKAGVSDKGERKNSTFVFGRDAVAFHKSCDQLQIFD